MLLRAEARRWAGTPHRMGGTDANGIDCSALVQTIYRQTFGTDVPRTTERQVQIGEAVTLDALQTGDLIFFRTGRRSRHVGIYLSGGEFLHVSRSMGVAISHLSETYWQRHYWTTRRVLPDTEAASSPMATPVASPDSATTISTPPVRRTGW